MLPEWIKYFFGLDRAKFAISAVGKILFFVVTWWFSKL